MDYQNTAPNSWEDANQPAAAPPTSSLSALSLNANAASFVPNANAAVFVPSWLPPAAAAPAPDPVKAPAPASPAPKPTPVVGKLTEKPIEQPSAQKAEKETKKEKSESKLKKDASKDSIAAIEEEIQSVLDPELFGEFYKEHLNVVFIGHVDAGKSTMGGNILFLTGMVDKRTMEKYEKEAKEAGRESWYLSWALDVDVKERNKGKTVECGKAAFETEKRRYTILDAPGHKNFVPSMITGASQADVAVLVISARKGEFETGFERGGQTREHAVLVKTAGVTKLIVAINKMDDATVKWSKERYDDIVSKLSPFLKGTGYNPKTDVEFIPVSGYSGANIKDAVTKDVCPWFDGIPLLEYLDNKVPITRKFNNPLMMPIADKYKEMGTIVTGKIESGIIKKNMSVLMMPSRKHCEIAAVFNEQDEELAGASCGDNIRLRLRGIEEEEILTGFVLCDTVKPVCTVTAFEAQVVILESKNIICAGYQAVLHIHNATEEVTFGELLHLIDKKTNRKSKRPPQFAKKGQKIIARLETQQPICVETFANYPQLGRFTLRDEALTIAIGKITKLIE